MVDGTTGTFQYSISSDIQVYVGFVCNENLQCVTAGIPKASPFRVEVATGFNRPLQCLCPCLDSTYYSYMNLLATVTLGPA